MFFSGIFITDYFFDFFFFDELARIEITHFTGDLGEFRLQLREDNADMRLTEAGRRMGLVDDARWDAFNRKRDAVSRETERLKATWVNPRNLPAAESERVLGKAIEHEYNLGDLLRRPGVVYEALVGMDGGKYASPAVSRETLGDLYEPVVEQIEIGAKYAGYIERQKDEVQRAAYYEHLKLPAELDYQQVSALSIEVRQKLARHRPETLGQASRISGVTPAAISLLLVHLKKNRFKGFDGAAAVAEPAVHAAAPCPAPTGLAASSPSPPNAIRANRGFIERLMGENGNKTFRCRALSRYARSPSGGVERCA